LIAFSDLNKENIAMDKIRAMLKSAWSWMISAVVSHPKTALVVMLALGALVMLRGCVG